MEYTERMQIVQRMIRKISSLDLLRAGAVPQGRQGGECPPMVFRKGKNEKTLGTFMCIGVIEISFSFILNKEIRAERASTV